jgi:hypothetical protein
MRLMTENEVMISNDCIGSFGSAARLAGHHHLQPQRYSEPEVSTSIHPDVLLLLI